jgi:LPXTG-motif cell wall-anchored protein
MSKKGVLLWYVAIGVYLLAVVFDTYEFFTKESANSTGLISSWLGFVLFSAFFFYYIKRRKK